MNMQKPNRPTIVTLCGSTRFTAEYQQANLEETLQGKIVLTIGCDMRADAHLFEYMNDQQKTKVKTSLDQLHFAKIEMSDEILVINPGGYIGESTRREIKYAFALGKRIRYWQHPDNDVVIGALVNG